MLSGVIDIDSNHTLEAALQLPATAQAHLLPDVLGGSVLSLAKFSCPTVVEFTGDLMDYLVSESAPVNLDYKPLKILSIPDETTVRGLVKMLKKLPSTQGICYAHVSDGAHVVWPLWVVTYWKTLHDIRESAELWSDALVWLGERQKSAKASVKMAANHIKELLASLQWNVYIHGFLETASASDLALFLSRKWLGSTQEDLMLEMIQDEVSKDLKPYFAHKFAPLSFSQKLLSIFTLEEVQKREELYKSTKWLHTIGEDLAAGRRKTIALIFNIRIGGGSGTHHWVAVIIDIENKCIRYGDPLGEAPPKSLVGALQHWIGMQTKTTYRFERLPSPRQNDSHSCGILAAIAIGHYYLPKTYPITDSETLDCDEKRLQVLQQILIRHTTNMDIINESEIRPKTPPNQDTVAATIELTSSISRMKVSDHGDVAADGKAISKRTKDDQFGPTNSPFSSPVKKKTKRAAKVEDLDSDTDHDRIREIPSNPFTIAKKNNSSKLEKSLNLTDSEEDDKPVKIAQSKPNKKYTSTISDTTNAGIGKASKKVASTANASVLKQDPGRPTHEILDILTKPEGNHGGVPAAERRWKCAGNGCRASWKGRTVGRVLRHAGQCQMLSEADRLLANQNLASNAVGAMVEALDEEAKKKGESNRQDGGKPVNESTSHDYFSAAGRKEHAIRITLCIVKLFSVGGIPPHILELREWKEFLKTAVPFYHAFSRNYFENRLVPQEAALVRQRQLEYLRGQSNLTISFDGGATRGGESFYTVHAITPDRLIFFLDGHSGVDFDHTARWLADVIIAIIYSIGLDKFAAIVSDSTGNTKGCRRLVTETIKTIFNLPDPAHHLNLTIKDICKLGYFKKSIRSMRRTLKFFSHSTKSKTKLSIALKELGITKGLRTIGKTRFATLTHAAVALRRCLPAIKKLVAEEELPNLPNMDLFTEHFGTSILFELNLTQFIDATLPIAKAITCLESTHSTLADVFLFSVAANATIKAALDKTSSGYTDDVKSQISEILNARHNEIFMDGPTDLHLTAFYLHPEYLNSPVLRKPNIFSPTITIPATAEKAAGLAKPPISNTRIFKRVGDCLGGLLHAEVLHGSNVNLTPGSRSQKALSKIRADFQTQFDNYARSLWPFDVSLADGETALNWWRSILRGGKATILATLAVKIFSVLPNSMADERTASNYTWINRPLRSSQLLSTITDQIHIRQYYRSDPKHGLPPAIPTVKFADLSKILPNKASVSEASNMVSIDGPVVGEPLVEILIEDPENDEVDDDNDDAPWLDAPPDIAFTGATDTEIFFDNEIDLESGYLLDLLADDGTASGSKKGKGREIKSDAMEPQEQEEEDFDPSTVDWSFQWSTD